jgi:hypothetical protein
MFGCAKLKRKNIVKIRLGIPDVNVRGMEDLNGRTSGILFLTFMKDFF